MKGAFETLAARIRRSVKAQDGDDLRRLGSELDTHAAQRDNRAVLAMVAAFIECENWDEADDWLRRFDTAAATVPETCRYHQYRLKVAQIPLGRSDVDAAIRYLVQHRQLTRFDSAAAIRRLAHLAGAEGLIAEADGSESMVFATDALSEAVFGQRITQEPVDQLAAMATPGIEYFEPARTVDGSRIVLTRRGDVAVTRPPIKLYRLQDVELHYSGTGMAIMAGDRLVSTLYNDQGLIELSSCGPRSDIPIESRQSGVLAIDMFAGPNYCHWVNDSLFRILALDEAYGVIGGSADIIVHGHAKFYESSARALGLSRNRLFRMQGAKRVRYRELFVSSSSFRDLRPPAQTGSAYVLEKLRAAVLGGPLPARAPKKIFIGRSDASQRRVVNQPALEKALKPLGFQSVVPGKLSFAQQVAAFASAEIVIGCHGAGVTNIAFAPQTSTLVEVFPPAFASPAYYFTSSGIGQNYVCMHGNLLNGSGVTTGPTSYYSAHDDFDIDIDKLVAYVEVL